MSRINTNIPSMIAARVYGQQNQALTLSLERLSTGLRINTGKDDPAGLIVSENLRAQKRAIEAAQYNIVRANNIVSVAESGLSEINRLLTELEDLVDKSSNEAGISTAERDANQAQIDAILSSINRISTSTEFQGRKLLSGELDYTTSGVSSTNFANVSILGARIANGSTRAAVVQVTGSAETARLNFVGTGTGAGTTTLEIKGNLGTEVLSFGSGATISQIRDAVNQVTSLTGVSATVSGANGLRFHSNEFGSSKFVSVKALTGTFSVTGGDAGSDKDFGKDAKVVVNGISATTDGLSVRVQSSVLSLKLDLTKAFGTALGSSTFYVTGGGADFMISPTVSLNGLESIGIQSVATGSLGTSTKGFLSSIGSGGANALSTGNFSTAQQIVRSAQTQIAELRGRLGAFQKDTLETTNNALDITLENTIAAESAIRDTDFARETSNLTRAQILVQSATNVLRIANAQPQSVLSLLG